jgi:hypothetical protein
MIGSNRTTIFREAKNAAAAYGLVPGLKKAFLESPPRALRSKPHSKFFAVLRSMDQRPRRWKMSSLVFIPQSDTLFWRGFYRGYPVQAISFVVPAVSGVAMIDGLPPADVETYLYGFGCYPPRAPSPVSIQPDNRTLSGRAADAGFPDARLVVFQSILEPPELFEHRLND